MDQDGLLDNVKIQNYLRLQFLLNATANSYIRELFISEWNGMVVAGCGNQQCLAEWKNNTESGTQFVSSVGAKLFKISKSIQKKYLQEGNINLWDLSLLAEALNSFKTTTPTKIQQTNSKALEQLKRIRNQQAHLGSIELEDDSFNQMWSDASSALLSLGLSQDILDAAKTVQIQGDNNQGMDPLNVLSQENQKIANDLKDVGNKRFKMNDFYGAIQKYTEAIQMPELPNNFFAILYSNRCISYLLCGEFENAKEDAKGAIHLRPTWFKGYFRLAQVYQHIQKFQKALKWNEIALGMQGDNAEVKNARDFCRHMIEKKKREEHLDPLTFATTLEDHAETAKRQGLNLNPLLSAMSQKPNFQKGTGLAICGEGHKYLYGDGVPQSNEMAARMFAKAAAKGNAEGLYNLAILTIEGKGVKQNVEDAIKLLFEAASQPPITELYPGSKHKARNIGVAEAQHSLGLKYQEGVGLPLDNKLAVFWYEKALKNGAGNSGNNLAIMYSQGQGVPQDSSKALKFWKASALKGCVRAMENIALEYLLLDLNQAQKWYMVAIEHGSVTLPLHKNKFFINDSSPERFESKHFLQEIHEQMMHTDFKEYVIPDNFPIHELMKEVYKVWDPLSHEYKVHIILNHRSAINGMRENKGPKLKWAANPSKLQPVASAFDIFGLKPILLKEMNQKEDHVYEGFAIKLTLIEDALVGEGRASVGLVAKDENGDVQRVYLYNYPQNKETQEALGFGSKVTVVNPYFRVTLDGNPALRIDDPSTIINHTTLRDPNQCRYCGQEKGALKCDKCKRVFYCSEFCMKKDAGELNHHLVCVKTL